MMCEVSLETPLFTPPPKKSYEWIPSKDGNHPEVRTIPLFVSLPHGEDKLHLGAYAFWFIHLSFSYFHSFFLQKLFAIAVKYSDI